MSKPKLSINKQVNKSYQELYEEYLKVAKIRNLSPVTIRTYKYHHNYWFQFVHEGLMCSEIDQELIDDYRLHLIDKGLSAVSVNSYISNISPVLKYGVERGYIPNQLSFKQLREEERIKEIYTQEELAILLKKPNMKKCSFAEFRNWVIINFLLGTGVRARELRNIKIKDVDLDNNLIALQVTKNKKARYIPIPPTLNKILSEYLPLRQANSSEEYLFCTQYGEMMPRTTLQIGITKYCKRRGVYKYSLHLFRHTFATLYIKTGNPFILQRILGHQSMKMVNHYLQMNTDDLKQNMAIVNPLEQVTKKRINMKNKGE